MNEPRISLDSNQDGETLARLQQRRGASKLDPKKSQFAKNSAPPITQQSFEEQADRAYEDLQARRQQALELVSGFWSLVKDETVPSQRGPLRKNLEKEQIDKLVKFSERMNNDPQEVEGAGSNALIALLLKILLYQRDYCNETRYRLSLLERKISKLEKADA